MTCSSVAGSSQVEIRALGPIEAMVSGRVVDLGTPKQRALLTLLVSQLGQPVGVDVMLEALWAGRPPPSGRTSLQAYVANLRRLLEPDRAPRAPVTVLRTCPPGYLLDGTIVDLDVHRFREHATAGWRAWDHDDPHRALSEFDSGLALWRGQSYLEIAEIPCAAPEVTRLEELRLAVHEIRGAALLAIGAHEIAVAELGAFMQANPLREYGCELLSLALYRAGRQADALDALRTIHGRLAEELGLDPRPALQHLRHEILNQSTALDWQPPSATLVGATTGPPARAPSAGPTDPPTSPDSGEEIFVGREVALRQLTEALAAATAGRGQVACVSGELGVGKTRLLERFAALAGVPVLRGACPEHVATPDLWLWEQVLRAATTAFGQTPIPAPVAELIDGNPRQREIDPGAAGATLRRFEAVVQYLTDVSLTAPLVVMLDHLHRADPTSLRLLAHVAESVPNRRLLLVVSYRSEEAPTLAEMSAALARRETTRIELKGLNSREARTLAGTLLHREIDVPTAEGLFARTEGNPFFLREVIKSCTSGLPPADPRTVPVPLPVREVALRRISRLPPMAAEVLSVAAVAGRHFDIEIVAEVMSIEIDAALAALDTAIAAGLVVEHDQRLGWFRFSQALVAESLYETIGRLRRTRLHRRIGTAVDRAWAKSCEQEAEIARHSLLADDLATPLALTSGETL